MAQKSELILGVRVDSTTKERVLVWLQKKVQAKGKKGVIFTPNPEIIVQAQRDQQFKTILNTADINIPDGVGLGLPVIRGRELFASILQMTLPNRKLKVFLLGSSEAVIKKCLAKIKAEGMVDAMGTSGPWVNDEAETDSLRNIALQKDAIDRINSYKPDVLFVGFGAPKQEKWIAKWLPHLKVRVAMAVGGSFNYFAGIKPIPPKLLADMGFEWLWRLTHEKGHLSRVIRALVVFPLLKFKAKLMH